MDSGLRLQYLRLRFAKGPCAQQFGTWDLGNRNSSTVLGKYMIIRYLDP